MSDFKQLNRSVKGLTALVTGAASGMGRATARVFAAEGAQTVGRPMSLPARNPSCFETDFCEDGWMDARIKSGHDSCVRRESCETLTSRGQGVAFCPKRSGSTASPDQEKTP